MTIFEAFLCLLIIHWVADFIFQTHWQATNKSKNNIALSSHVAVYTACLMVFSPFLFGLSLATFSFVLINGLLHFVTDYFTSRATSKLWAVGDTHNFFVIVGLDQLIHQFTLGLTAYWLFYYA